ncbi:MAG TPA: hypothetical protein VIV40_23165 [Kofleriaceae bacterium]
MNKLLSAALIFTMGCGTILNSRTATIYAPGGSSVDGAPSPIMASQKHAHEVVYPDGRRCIVESSVSAGYLVLDIVLFFTVLPLVIDAVTENWKTLDADSCPGVMIN